MKYHNRSVDLLKKNKESHYKKHVKRYQKKCKAVLNGISEVI